MSLVRFFFLVFVSSLTRTVLVLVNIGADLYENGILTYNVYFFSVEFSRLQLVDEPLQLRGGIRTVQQKPPTKSVLAPRHIQTASVFIPVFVIAVIHVEGNQSESWPDQHRVERTPPNRITDRTGQPLPPLDVQLVV